MLSHEIYLSLKVFCSTLEPLEAATPLNGRSPLENDQSVFSLTSLFNQGISGNFNSAAWVAYSGGSVVGVLAKYWSILNFTVIAYLCIICGDIWYAR